MVAWQEKRNYPLTLFTEASIDLADDPELMDLMVQANFIATFIGIESPDEESLREAKKFQNVRTGGTLLEKVHRIQEAGMEVWCGMIMGFDNDDIGIFDRQIQFVRESRISFSMSGMLSAIPKTPLHERLAAEGRLDTADTNEYGTNVVPLLISRGDLLQGYIRVLNELYDTEAYFDRTDSLWLKPSFDIGVNKKRNWLSTPRSYRQEAYFLAKSVGLFIRLMTRVREPELRREYRQRLWRFLKVHRRPGLVLNYLFHMTMHYHAQYLAKRMAVERAAARQFVLMNDGNCPMDAEDRPLSVFGESANGFPKLPILSPAEIPPPGSAVKPRSQFEKYGGLFYLGIAGLAVLACWSAGSPFDSGASGTSGPTSTCSTIQAHPSWIACRPRFVSASDPRVNDAQRMEMCLRRDVPDLARYLLAEAVSTDAVARDPRSFALTVARSPDWPDWLRLLLARRLAYGAARGYAIPREALAELAGHSDPMIGLWADCALDPAAGVGPEGRRGNRASRRSCRARRLSSPRSYEPPPRCASRRETRRTMPVYAPSPPTGGQADLGLRDGNRSARLARAFWMQGHGHSHCRRAVPASDRDDRKDLIFHAVLTVFPAASAAPS